MLPIIIFRGKQYEPEEFSSAQNYFATIEHRSKVKNFKHYGDLLIVPRYSCLPHYKEFENDIEDLGGKLVNSYNQHLWIANFDYYHELKEYTPETWENIAYCNYQGPFVVKGKTNSKKQGWNKTMFAPTKEKAIEIASSLYTDGLICNQDVIFRKYIPLKTFEIGINDLPFTNEWRIFFYKKEVVAYGYYWSNAENPEKAYITDDAWTLANKIATIASNFVNFFVLDIAETQEGKWILIEMNDGSCSGLSEINPNAFYQNLAKVLKKE